MLRGTDVAIKRLPATGDRPRSTGVPDSLVPGGSGDSAGFSWSGRTFAHHDTSFADDTGEAPAGLLECFARVGEVAARVSAVAGGWVEVPVPGFMPEVEVSRALAAFAPLLDVHAEAHRMLAGSRLLLPLLTDAGSVGVTPEGRIVDKTQELSISLLNSPEGRRTMPAFTSVAALTRWCGTARPIPMPVPQLALAAWQEKCELLVIDPDGAGGASFGVRGMAFPVLCGVADFVPAWAVADVLLAVGEIAARLGFSRAACRAGDPAGRLAGPEVEVCFNIGQDAAGLDSRVFLERFAGFANDMQVFHDRVDSIVISLRSSINFCA